MKYVAADQTEFAFQIRGAQRHLSEYQMAESRRMIFHYIEYGCHCRIAVILPASAVWQLRRKLLAEQTRDMLTSGCQAVVDKAGYEHFDDRLA